MFVYSSKPKQCLHSSIFGIPFLYSKKNFDITILFSKKRDTTFCGLIQRLSHFMPYAISLEATPLHLFSSSFPPKADYFSLFMYVCPLDVVPFLLTMH